MIIQQISPEVGNDLGNGFAGPKTMHKHLFIFH